MSDDLKFKLISFDAKGNYYSLPPSPVESPWITLLGLDRTRFADERGVIDEFAHTDPEFRAQHVTVTRSYENVFRGIHGMSSSERIIVCLAGEIRFVAVDCFLGSPRFGKSYVMTIKSDDPGVIVPPWVGTGMLTTSDQSMIMYMCNQPYDILEQFAYAWNNIHFDLGLPKDMILSERDRSYDPKTVFPHVYREGEWKLVNPFSRTPVTQEIERNWWTSRLSHSPFDLKDKLVRLEMP